MAAGSDDTRRRQFFIPLERRFSFINLGVVHLMRPDHFFQFIQIQVKHVFLLLQNALLHQAVRFFFFGFLFAFFKLPPVFAWFPYPDIAQQQRDQLGRFFFPSVPGEVDFPGTAHAVCVEKR
ncbi:hypothetical protein [Atopococcus tabaci]|uniref:hypothetical protein n=1 Tax=Atopococcus tabaci TaxID=269774 RepID=UPI00240940DB|nr:hypothetical protein [Atopococcus tabaci]